MKVTNPLVKALFGGCLFGLAQTPAQAVSFPPFGAGGDAAFSDVCPGGQYMIGVRVRSGLWLDQMAIICAVPSGVGPHYVGPARGGNGGGPGERTCPPGQLINNMNFTLTKGNRQVVKFSFNCSSPNGASRSLFNIGGSYTSNNPFPPGQSCPKGEGATGMAGRFGKDVNAVGLICNKLPAAVPAVTPPSRVKFPDKPSQPK